MQSCIMDWEYAYYLRNDAEYPITVLELSESWTMENELYSDTTLPYEVAYYSLAPAHKGWNANIWPRSTELEDFMERRQIDTVCVFVFKSETLQKCSWDSIRSGYLVLQRYDLSREDVISLKHTYLCFPPSEAMKGIRMWPPYGTYDEEGNVVERRNTQKTTKNNKP